MSEARRVRRLVKRKLEGKGKRPMQRRYIVVLKPLPLYDLDGRTQARDERTDTLVTVSLEKFIEGRTTDPAFVSDIPREPNTVQWTMLMVVSAEAVRAAFRGKVEGDVVELDEDDWQRLKRATENGAYHVVAAASLIPFMRAIVDAALEDPRKV